MKTNAATRPITPTRLTNKQLNVLHKSVAEGIITLQQQSEAFGNKVATNRASLLFLALALQLDENGVLDHLAGLAHWAREKAS